MKKVGSIVLAGICVMALGLGDVYAQKGGGNNANRISPSAVARLNGSGDVLGQLVLVDDKVVCEGVPPSAVLVYIPGHSFMVKPDDDGMFKIYNVPAGTYNLVVELPGFEPFFVKGINGINGINVQAKMITNLTDNNPGGQGPIYVDCIPLTQ